MEFNQEIRDVILKNKEVILSIYIDALVTYLKLFLTFPKQRKERIHFKEEILSFCRSLYKENTFLRSVLKEGLNDEEIEEILNSFDLAFQKDYEYYDGLIGYMESSIEKHELHFYKQKQDESTLCKQMKKYNISSFRK